MTPLNVESENGLSRDRSVNVLGGARSGLAPQVRVRFASPPFFLIVLPRNRKGRPVVPDGLARAGGRGSGGPGDPYHCTHPETGADRVTAPGDVPMSSRRPVKFQGPGDDRRLAASRRTRRGPVRFGLEPLEDRCLLSTTPGTITGQGTILNHQDSFNANVVASVVYGVASDSGSLTFLRLEGGRHLHRHVDHLGPDQRVARRLGVHHDRRRLHDHRHRHAQGQHRRLQLHGMRLAPLPGQRRLDRRRGIRGHRAQ